MIAALVLAAAAATAPPPHTGVGGNAKPSTANSHASRAFSGAYERPGMGTAPPLLKKSAPALNVHATAGPLLRKAAPGSKPNAAGEHALHEYSGAYTPAGTVPGAGNQGGRWGWAGLFGALGLIGLWGRSRV